MAESMTSTAAGEKAAAGTMIDWEALLAESSRIITMTERLMDGQRNLIAALTGDAKDDAENIFDIANDALTEFKRNRELLKLEMAGQNRDPAQDRRVPPTLSKRLDLSPIPTPQENPNNFPEDAIR